VTTDRVSVVMPAWNAERFIEEALRSILDQTVPPAQVVVVDDGSTDATAHLAASVGGPVTVIRQAHAGIGRARTAGVAATTSEFVALLDADDLWLPTKLERQLAVMDACPETDAVFCHIEEFSDPVDVPPPGVRRPSAVVAAALTSAALLRRPLLDRLGPFPTTLVGDWAGWWARARAQGVREEFVPEVLVRRRLHGSNNSHLLDDQGRTMLAVARAHRQAMRDRS
jgi:glycosyltransferase involved in cell wall biosynthesis